MGSHQVLYKRKPVKLLKPPRITDDSTEVGLPELYI